MMTPTRFDVDAIRARFPALARTGRDRHPYVWADCPGGSQVPESVIAAIAERMREGASNTHGAFPVSREIDDLLESAHRAGADFLGCDPQEVVFGQNATTLLLHLSRSLARTLEPGDEVVVTRLDHDANVRPWILAARDAGATVRWVDVDPADTTLDLPSLETALSDRTRLVACTMASNAAGTIPPISRVITLAKDAGALVALDGVHLAQHRPIDLHRSGADIVATSPYKFFGPHMGMLGIRREVLGSWVPYKVDAVPDDAPDRWETGTLSHEALAGTIAAIDYLAGLGRDYGGAAGHGQRDQILGGFAAFAGHERDLSLRFLDGLSRIPAAELIGISDPARVDERTPTFAIRLGEQHPLDTSAALAERGVFTWDGHYYAIEIFRRLGLLEDGGAVRIGFCHYHTVGEVDRVLQAIADCA